METFTFLFTDIEGSTALLRRLREGLYAQVLTDHRSLIRSGLTAHGGQEVDTQGDGLFAVFSSPSACLAAVIDMQKGLETHAWPGGEHVRVRMGIHTGEASQTATGLVGLDVHRAARVAAVFDPDAVPSAIAGALGIAPQGGRAALEVLLDALAPQDILIVLDNCEHLIDACAKTADALLRRCPRVHLVATSREPLGINGETIYRVPPLSLTASGGPGSVAPEASDAVALFVDRARAQGAGLFSIHRTCPSIVTAACAATSIRAFVSDERQRRSKRIDPTRDVK